MFHRLALMTLFLAGTAFAAAPDAAPEGATLDGNPRSATYGLEVGVADFEGQVTLWYFGDSTGPELNTVFTLWQELADDGVKASIVTVMSAKDVPRTSVAWLHDDDGALRNAWAAEAGQVVVVDAAGVIRDRFDVTEPHPTLVDELEERIEVAAFGGVAGEGAVAATK